MINTIVTLFKGQAADVAENFADANSMQILRQQMREARLGISKSRKSVAIAIASQNQEVQRYERITNQIADLETRSIAALAAQKDELAFEAAEAIASLEEEKAASEKTQKRYSSQISRLRSEISTAQLKMRDLERGQRLAVATNHTQEISAPCALNSNNSLKEAEKTLQRLEKKQQHIDLTRKAEAELEQSTAPAELAIRMADQGLGSPVRSSAHAVLERLKADQKKSKTKVTKQ